MSTYGKVAKTANLVKAKSIFLGVFGDKYVPDPMVVLFLAEHLERLPRDIVVEELSYAYMVADKELSCTIPQVVMEVFQYIFSKDDNNRVLLESLKGLNTAVGQLNDYLSEGEN